MRYVVARQVKEQRAAAYRIYVTDSLYYMAQDMRPSMRFYDVLNGTGEDDRSAEEVAYDIISGAGLTFKGE